VTSIAIVTPWFGRESTGGAESLARELAARLSLRGFDVTILTTCSRSFLARWDLDHFEPGETHEDGYTVRRYRVAPRDAAAFDNVNAAILAMQPHEWPALRGRAVATAPFIEESINAPDLEAHLASAGSSYDACLFIPYLYGVVVRGIRSLGPRAHLIPCLHDEGYARIPRIADALHECATLLFNSDGEAELATRIYGPGVLHKAYVIGSGLDAPAEPATDPIPYLGQDPFVLCLGRRDATKNVDFLADAYLGFRQRCPESDLRFVLAGPGERSYSKPGSGIIDLGFVDASMKRTLLQRASALLQPSTNESYSRVLMEAWREHTPVVAHRDCLATATAVKEARGGLLAGSRDEWIEVLELIDAGKIASVEMGERGAEYARDKSDWDGVIDRLIQATGLDKSQRWNGKRVDQVVQTLEYGDAISDYATHVRNRLREVGFASTIWAEGIGPLVMGNADFYDADAIEKADAIVYHHSIGTAATEHVQSLRLPKAMIYHNITPASFFAPYRPKFAELLETGRDDLKKLVGAFDRYIADSDFNAAELRDIGVSEVETVPVIMDFSRFDVSADVELLAENSRGMRWIFVGRVAPNKGVHSLILALEAFLHFDHDAQLDIVGRYDVDDPYYAELRALVTVRRLERYVHFRGMVTDSQLLAYYQRSNIFVTLSEHEGFCVPVVEAMLFDLPVVALASTALPETLGHGGLLVEPGTSPAEIAALIYLVRVDPHLGPTIVAAQRERRTTFLPKRIYPKLEHVIAELLA
jgi:glycosyltransferase involved in cell wall biosynthesis